jgi:Domain of unknown function (DUF3291)
MTHHLAELNIARLRQPLDHPDMNEFVAVLDAVNAIAEATPGFVWRLRDDDGRSSSYVQAMDDPLTIVNLSVWTDVAPLRHFVYRSGHQAYLRRRREWFEETSELTMVCWWMPAGAQPGLDDALRRLMRLRAEGPSEDGFAFGEPLPKPD